MKLKKWFTELFWSKWKVARSGWPYPSGYAVYREHLVTGHKIILDTGITRQQAEDSCKKLNER